MSAPFQVGQQVQMRDKYRRPGDFSVAVVSNVDEDDDSVEVTVDGVDWGQWFCRFSDGTYEIEPVDPAPPCVPHSYAGAHVPRETEEDL